MNIYQKIHAVQKEVDYVQKDATIKAGGSTYKAVTHDMVLAILRPAMVKQGIVTQVEQLRSELLQARSANPKKEGEFSMHLYSADYAVHFVNKDEPSDRLTVTINAHANDTGDKAPGKATSYAVKYAMLKTFGLETGENDEARFSDPYSSEQLEIYHDLLEAGKAYEFYMFIAALPPETQVGLYNSFPEGKKVQGKKAASKLEDEGGAIFSATVEDIQARLAKHDETVLEKTDELNPMEKAFLRRFLSDYDVRELAKMTKARAVSA
jgi:hypothetical protein